MKLLALSALICVLMAPTLAAGPLDIFKRGWGWYQIGDRNFQYYDEPRNWNAAEQHCSSLGGHLASVYSVSEYHDIQSLIQKSSEGFGETWIGGNDQVHEGVWHWTDGTTFGYTSWCEGEPNNGGGGYPQNYLQINFSSNKCWDDLGCQYPLPYVCVRTSKP